MGSKFLVSVLILSLTTVVVAQEPRTGYFRKSMTPMELLGSEGASAIESVFAVDQRLSWQLYVPDAYDASKPPGLVVFSSRHTGGGGQKSWNRVLEDRNLIWVGARDAGDASPMNERMLKAMLARAMVAADYAIDADRVYVSGFSGGAHVASILATSKPEVFRGGLFMSGAVAWGDKLPAKIDMMRQCRYFFITGSNDVAKTKVARTAAMYRDAGVLSTQLMIVPNMRQAMPGPSYFGAAIDYLDTRQNDKAKQE